MYSPVTGYRGRGATTQLRCVDVAALAAAALLRRHPESVVVPFDTQVYRVQLDPHDSILSLAERPAQCGGGGTDCSLPLREGNERYAHRRFIGCVLVSDNQSWVYRGAAFASGPRGETGVMREWDRFVRLQHRLHARETDTSRGSFQPKLACIDVQPYLNTQVPERDDVLNIGSFSDAVFDVLAAFFASEPARFVAEIGAIDLAAG